MKEYGFSMKRDRTPEQPVSPKDHVITDLPHRKAPNQPKEQPSPPHRPGEPILYDPPTHGMPMVDPTHSPLSGLGINDPLEFK